MWLRGELDPSKGPWVLPGERPPTTGGMDRDMEGRMEEEEASRLGSLQTEVGGPATNAISGICWWEVGAGKVNGR